MALWNTKRTEGRRLVSKIDILFITQVANLVHEILDQHDATKILNIDFTTWIRIYKLENNYQGC